LEITNIVNPTGIEALTSGRAITESVESQDKSKFIAELEKATGSKTAPGYAYIDKYGFSHVVKSYDTALQFAKPDTGIYAYHGKFSGGYAVNSQDTRLAIPLPGAVAYGNGKIINNAGDTEESGKSGKSVGHVENTKPMAIDDFLEKYPGFLSLQPITVKAGNIIDSYLPFAEEEGKEGGGEGGQ
jgi:hypothetical protein